MSRVLRQWGTTKKQSYRITVALEQLNILTPLCSIYWLGFKEITCLQKEAAKDQMMESIEKPKGSTNLKRIEN